MHGHACPAARLAVPCRYCSEDWPTSGYMKSTNLPLLLLFLYLSDLFVTCFDLFIHKLAFAIVFVYLLMSLLYMLDLFLTEYKKKIF